MDSNKIQITLNENGKPCIKFRHNDKSKSNDDLLIGLFVKEAMQNGLKISSPNGYLNTTTGESFENYVIEVSEPKGKPELIEKPEVNTRLDYNDLVLTGMSRDREFQLLKREINEKDLRIKELESEVSLLKVTNQVQADLFNGKLKDIIKVEPKLINEPKGKQELKATLNGNELVFSAVNESESIKETEGQLQANLFKKYKELESSAAITVLNAAIAKLIESNKEPVITKQDIINATPQRFKTGLADDEQPEPIESNNLCHLSCPNSCGKVCEQYLKTGKVCDLESNIINKFKDKYSGDMNLPNWVSFIKEEAEPSELETKSFDPHKFIQQEFANDLNNEIVKQILAELKTIVQRDKEIKDKLKVLFAEHSKALTEAIETNKRIETLIINL